MIYVGTFSQTHRHPPAITSSSKPRYTLNNCDRAGMRVCYPTSPWRDSCRDCRRSYTRAACSHGRNRVEGRYYFSCSDWQMWSIAGPAHFFWGSLTFPESGRGWIFALVPISPARDEIRTFSSMLIGRRVRLVAISAWLARSGMSGISLLLQGFRQRLND